MNSVKSKTNEIKYEKVHRIGIEHIEFKLHFVYTFVYLITEDA